MTFSVVIPVYDGERFIRGCVESVRAQTHAPLEIIVVNDGSTDGTERELESLQRELEDPTRDREDPTREREDATREREDPTRDRAYPGPVLRVLRQPNQGRSAARNEGMRAARGDYVAFLDADDRFLPEHLAQLAGAVEDGEPEIVHDGLEYPYLSEGERAADLRRRARDRREDHLRNFFVTIQTTAIKRSWFEANDLTFEIGREFAEDALFIWSAIVLGARIRFVPRPGTTYGVHAGNTTRDRRRTHEKTIDVHRALEAFIEERGLEISAREKARIEGGKRHARIMSSLHELYVQGGGAPRRELRSLVLSRYVMPVDRVRCVLAQVWPYFPLSRHRKVVRSLFGFSALRVEDEPS